MKGFRASSFELRVSSFGFRISYFLPQPLPLPLFSLMSHHAPIEIRIDSDPKHLCVVRSAVESAAERWGLPAVDCDRLVLAVDEALTNIIRHGYHGRDDRSIWVTLSPLPHPQRQGIEVVIEDETDNADPAAIKPKAAANPDIDDLKPGGLGVSIIEQSVDHHCYQCRTDAKGLRLTLHKYASEESA